MHKLRLVAPAAQYVGRVGALAVALGVGAALATTPATAWAEPSVEAPADTTAPPADVTAPATPDPTSSKAADRENDGDDVTGVAVGQADSPPVSIAVSGGANAAINGDPVDEDLPESLNEGLPEPHVTETNDSPTVPAVAETSKAAAPKDAKGPARIDPLPAADPVSTVAAAVINLVTTALTPAAGPPITPPASPPPASPSTSRSVAIAENIPAATDPVPVNPVSQLVAAVLAPLITPGPEVPRVPVFAWTVLAWVRREIDNAARSLAPPASPQVTTSQTLARTATPSVSAAAAPAPQYGLLPTLTYVVSGTGNVVGGVLGFLGAVIGGVANQPPTANPSFTGVNDQTGTVTGKLNATDPNGDAMTYAVTTGPTKGTAAVDAAGTFTYTPTAAARAQAATTAGPDYDSFTITITDARGARTTVAISNAPITPPANRAPVATATTGPADPRTGSVAIAVTASDPDGDPLSYSVTSAPRGGTLVATGPGTFTYTAGEPARVAAEGTPGPDIDSFTITVSDGRGGTTAVPVTATVAPAVIVNHTIEFTGDYVWTSMVNEAETRMTVITVSTDTATGAASTHVGVVDLTTAKRVGTDVALPGRFVESVSTPDGARAVIVTSDAIGPGGGYNQYGDFTTWVTVVDTATGTRTGSTVSVEGGADRLITVDADADRMIITTRDTLDSTSSTTTRVAIVDTDNGRQVGTTVAIAGVLSSSSNGQGDTLLLVGDDRIVVTTLVGGINFSDAISKVTVIDTVNGMQIGTTTTLNGVGGARATPNGSTIVATAQRFTYDGSTGTISNDSSQIAMIDSATGQRRGSTITVDGVGRTELSSDGSRAVAVWVDRPGFVTRMAIFDTATASQVGSTVELNTDLNDNITLHGDRAVTTRVVADGTLRMRVIDLETGNQIGTGVDARGTGYIEGLHKVTDHNVLFDLRYTFDDPVGGPGRTYVSTLDLNTGNQVSQTVIDGVLYDSRLTSDESRVIIATQTGGTNESSPRTNVAVFSVHTGAQIGDTVTLQGGGHYGDDRIAIIPDQTRAWVSPYADGNGVASVALFDLSTGAQIGTATTIPGRADIGTWSRRPLFSPDGSRLVLMSDGGPTQWVTVFDNTTGAKVGESLGIDGEAYGNIQFTADSKRAIVSVGRLDATGDSESAATVVDLGTGARIGQPFVYRGFNWSYYWTSPTAPTSTAVEFGLYGFDRDLTSITVVDTDYGARIGSAELYGFPQGTYYRPDGAYATVVSLDYYTPGSFIVNVTHVQTRL